MIETRDFLLITLDEVTSLKTGPELYDHSVNNIQDDCRLVGIKVEFKMLNAFRVSIILYFNQSIHRFK